MNIVVLSGRLTKDPDIRYTQDQNSMAVAHFTLAVDRNRTDAQGNKQTDFIRCVVFGKRAEWMEKYIHKGMKVEVSGRWQTGSYTDKNNQTVYTNDCICNDVQFGESKAASQAHGAASGGYSNQGSQQTGQYGGGGGNATQTPQNGYQQNSQNNAPAQPAGLNGFMNIPDDIDEELPFN